MLEFREHLRSVPEEDHAQELRRHFSGDALRKAAVSPYLKAYPQQLEALTSDADTVLMLMGRQAGKNWTGAHWLLDKARHGHTATAAVAATAGEARDDLVEPANENGIVDFGARMNLEPDYQNSKARVELHPQHGTSRIQLYSGDTPDTLAGFSGSALWVDEWAKQKYGDKVLSQADFVLREGNEEIGDAQMLITTTPRPKPFVKELVEEGETNPNVDVIRATSWDNPQMGNRMRRKLEEKYEGTRLGDQEIYANILEDAGDLWDYDDIESVSHPPEELDRICIGLDPTVSDDEDSDECGIVVAGLKGETVYVLADLSGTYTTQEWGALVIAAYKGNIKKAAEWLDSDYSEDVRKAINTNYKRRPVDVIHAETNQGGELITQQLRTYGTNAAVNATHTTQSKKVRAEPVHHLYQRGLVKHVGSLSTLEQQLTDFLQEADADSPDRADALCYAVHELKDLSSETDRTQEAWDTILSIN